MLCDFITWHPQGTSSQEKLHFLLLQIPETDMFGAKWLGTSMYYRLKGVTQHSSLLSSNGALFFSRRVVFLVPHMSRHFLAHTRRFTKPNCGDELSISWGFQRYVSCCRKPRGCGVKNYPQLLALLRFATTTAS